MPIERQAADVIITNANIRTLDAADSTFQALATKGDKIVGLGSNSEVESLADAQTRIIDAGGRTVLPAFTDTHTHFRRGSLVEAYFVNYETIKPRTLAEALQPIRDRAAALPPGTWIRGFDFGEHHVAEKRVPSRRELDEAAPNHPVVIYTIGLHMAVANSLALKLAGIARDSADPPGGRIDRDKSGEPTGVLRERAKGRLDYSRADSVIPPLTPAQRLDGLRAGIRKLHEYGIASFHAMVAEVDEISDYQRLRAEQVKARIQLLIRGVESQIRVEDVVGLGLTTGFGDDWLKIAGIKMSVDGVCVCKNAAVYEPYPGEPENCGIVRIEQDELEEKVALSHKAGLRVSVHAIGQRAVDMTLRAFEKALTAEPRPDHRHRIEHAYLPPRPNQLERMRDLGLLLSTQPSFIESFGDGWIDVFGRDQLGGVMPLRRALALGLRVQANSDFPCSPMSPFLNLKSAVARRTRAGNVLDPGEAISVGQALRLLTTEAAYAGFEERKRGSLELGKLADMIIVSDDPYHVPAHALDQIKVDTTIVGGDVVFERATQGRALREIGG
jgi:predicted amidohydrolase YtcJ